MKSSYFSLWHLVMTYPSAEKFYYGPLCMTASSFWLLTSPDVTEVPSSRLSSVLSAPVLSADCPRTSMQLLPYSSVARSLSNGPGHSFHGADKQRDGPVRSLLVFSLLSGCSCCCSENAPHRADMFCSPGFSRFVSLAVITSCQSEKREEGWLRAHK